MQGCPASTSVATVPKNYVFMNAHMCQRFLAMGLTEFGCHRIPPQLATAHNCCNTSVTTTPPTEQEEDRHHHARPTSAHAHTCIHHMYTPPCPCGWRRLPNAASQVRSSEQDEIKFASKILHQSRKHEQIISSCRSCNSTSNIFYRLFC